MLNAEPFVSTAVLKGFDVFLQRWNISLDDVLSAAHVSRDELYAADHSEIRLQTVTSILDAAAVAARAPCLGAQWAETYDSHESGVYGYLLYNAATVREAIDVTVRYISLMIYPVTIEVMNDGATTVLMWRLPPRLQSRSTQYLLFAAGAAVSRLRAAAGGEWDPIQVELTCPELPCKTLLRRLFGPSITFGAKATRIFVSTRSLDRRNPNADARLFDLLQNLGDRLLDERSTQNGYPSFVKSIIAGRLGRRDVTLESVADDIQTSPRKLKSRLKAEGTSFEELLQLTKKELAAEYLAETDLPMTEIALLLGFSELSAFSRACHRWFDMSPSDRRHGLRQARPTDAGKRRRIEAKT